MEKHLEKNVDLNSSVSKLLATFYDPADIRELHLLLQGNSPDGRRVWLVSGHIKDVGHIKDASREEEEV